MTTAMRACFGIVPLLALALAACAGLAPKPPYEGVFTGELVDGRPLYRFPTIEVVGRR